MATFSRAAASQVLEAMHSCAPPAGEEGSKLTVNETVSKFAFLYEKIRNVVDYKDEHLIRKGAIVRILKRQLILESDSDVIARGLLIELIGARYLPNGTLPESIISEVALRIRKIKAVMRIKAGPQSHLDWLLSIVAVEIEDLLVDGSREKALVTFLYARTQDSVTLKGVDMDPGELRLQMYVACYRSFVKADDEMVAYKLLRAYLPEWLRPEEWLSEPRPIAERLLAVERRIRAGIAHPLAPRFLRTVRPWAIATGLLRDVLLEREDMAILLEQPEQIFAKVADKAEQRYAIAKTTLRRGTVRAMLYLFATKMMIALILEVPLELLLYGVVNRTPLIINLAFPPVLMFLVGMLIRVPDGKNTERLTLAVRELLAEEPLPKKEVRPPSVKKGLRGFLFTLVYAATFVISFGLTALVLHALDFTWVSSLIFMFFLSLVSFFAFRLRLASREIVVVDGKQGLIAVIVDFFSLPVLRAGQWLSRTVSRLNVFLFVFDFLIEAPFKLFLGVLEEWFAFMKEKKDELQ